MVVNIVTLPDPRAFAQLAGGRTDPLSQALRACPKRERCMTPPINRACVPGRILVLSIARVSDMGLMTRRAQPDPATHRRGNAVAPARTVGYV